MGVLSIVVPDALVRARLARSLRPAYRLVFHDGWKQFERALMEVEPVATVVDLFHPQGPRSEARLMAAARECGFGVVICSSFIGREDRLYALGVAGIGSVILEAEAGRRSVVRSAVEKAIARSIADGAAAALADSVPEEARTTLHWAVLHATEEPGVKALAAETGCSPESLRDGHRALGLPPPKRFLLWGRLLFAARSLARADASIETLAHRLGYASRSGLTRMMTRELGAPPRALRRQDVWGQAIAVLTRELTA